MGIHVAIDVGTTSAKLVSGRVESDALRIHEVHRFEPAREGDVERRDVDAIVDEIVAGLELAEAEHGAIDTVGIDATAAEFGFVADDSLVEDPVRGQHAVPDGVSARAAFRQTGHRRLPGAYYHAVRERPSIVDTADWLLFLPSLLAHELGARPHAELSYAVSSGLGNVRTGTWATELLAEFGLPTDPLPPLEPIGASVGTVDPARCDLDTEPEIVVVPGHDTTAAVAALPFERSRAFLATGSWFIPGFEVDEPIVGDTAFDVPAENMSGIEGTVRFVRNIPGFSVLEHCRDEWRDAGGVHAYDSLVEAAANAEPHGSLVDVADPALRDAHRGRDPLDRIAEYCRNTGQTVPQDEGEVTRCLLESLAAQSAILLRDLGAAADEPLEELRVCGGGVNNEWFCGTLADATDVPVLAGPAEATAVGNLLVQLDAADEIESIADGRALVGRRFDIDRYEPAGSESWTETVERLRALRG